MTKSNIDELKAEERRPGTINYIHLVTKLSREWSADPELKECMEYLTADHVAMVLRNKQG